MSTNLRIEKTCQGCGKKFTAKTFVTRYCSHRCNSRDYKKNQQAIRLGVMESTGQANVILEKPPDVLDNDYLDVDEAAKHMRISKRTLYRLIASRHIRKKKIRTRTVILKKDIKLFFKQQ